MNSRTILLAVLGVVIAAGAVWYFFMQDEVVVPQVMQAKPAPKVEAKPAAAPGADAPKPAAAAAAPGAAPAQAPAAPSGPRDLATVERELKASQTRVGQLEKQSADLQQQIEAKNREIAAMEKKVAGK